VRWATPTAAGSRHFDGRIIRSRFLLFLIISMDASGQCEKDQQTNNRSHRASSMVMSAAKRSGGDKKILLECDSREGG
jgi:hypothetical protein